MKVDWAQIEPLFDQLDERPIDTAAQLERWLADMSELAACISEEGSNRYVAMTRATDDETAEKGISSLPTRPRLRCAAPTD